MTYRITGLTQNMNWDGFRIEHHICQSKSRHSSQAMVKKYSENEEATKVITVFRSVMDSAGVLPLDVRDKICDYLFEPPLLSPVTQFPCCNTDRWPTFGIVDEQTLPEVFDLDWRSRERGSREYCIHTMNAAIFKNNILIIHHIVFRARHLLQSRDERGFTPLVTSILLRKYEAAQTLLDLGADPKLPAESNGRFGIPQGAIPVWIAAAKIKNLRFVELLVSYMPR